MPAKRAVYKGIEFDSRAEAGYYAHLLMQQRTGHVADITLQPTWDLYAAQVDDFEVLKDEIYPAVKVGRYTADFQYLDKERDEIMVVDIKGQVPKTITRKNGTKRRVSGGKGWTAFRLRAQILKANYGIEVTVVEGATYTQLANELRI